MANRHAPDRIAMLPQLLWISMTVRPLTNDDVAWRSIHICFITSRQDPSPYGGTMLLSNMTNFRSSGMLKIKHALSRDNLHEDKIKQKAITFFRFTTHCHCSYKGTNHVDCLMFTMDALNAQNTFFVASTALLTVLDLYYMLTWLTLNMCFCSARTFT